MFPSSDMSKYLSMCCNDDEMREATAKICKDFLHGAWKTVAPQDLVFKRISGGLSNYLFYVALPEKNVSLKEDNPIIGEDDNKKSTIGSLLSQPYVKQTTYNLEEPSKVLVRIYGETQNERGVDNIIVDSVIFTLLSERKLGPKLYGVFPGGRIEEYIPARQLYTRELGDPAFSMKIAEKMAAIHSMDVPLSKQPHWLWKKMAKWLITANAHLDTYVPKNKIEIENLNKLKAYDLAKEISWLNDYLKTINSPVVFCHNDLQEGNILLKQDIQPEHEEVNDDVNIDYASLRQMDNSSESFQNGDTPEKHFTEKSEKSVVEDDTTNDSICSATSDDSSNIEEPKLVLIDYEYCSYNHRGFDLANHFVEWVYDYTNPDYPYYYEHLDHYPTLEQKVIFMRQYLSRLCRVPPSEITIEEINLLNTEVEAYSMASHLFWTLWSIVNAAKSQIPFGHLEYGASRLDWYNRLKQKVIKESGIPCLKRKKIREEDI